MSVGGWIKMRHDLADDPAVPIIAERSGRSEVETLGLLYLVWSWFDRHESGGVLRGVTMAAVDRKIGAPGFAQAMASVDWLAEDEAGIRLPKQERHNGGGAKQRAVNAARQASYRSRNAESVTSVTPERYAERDIRNACSVTRQEKSREEKKRKTKTAPASGLAPVGDAEAIPAGLDSEPFRSAWADWNRHRKELRKPMTPTSRAQLLAQLAEWGQDRAIVAIRHTIAKGWQGLREPEAARVNGYYAAQGRTVHDEINAAIERM